MRTLLAGLMLVAVIGCNRMQRSARNELDCPEEQMHTEVVSEASRSKMARVMVGREDERDEVEGIQVMWGCGREVTCSANNDECKPSPTWVAASGLLSMNTGCPPATVVLEQKSPTTTNGTATYRINTCRGPHICTAGEGFAPQCQPAQGGQPGPTQPPSAVWNAQSNRWEQPAAQQPTAAPQPVWNAQTGRWEAAGKVWNAQTKQWEVAPADTRPLPPPPAGP